MVNTEIINKNSMRSKFILFTLLVLFLCNTNKAQTFNADTFKLVKNNSHYLFSTKINNKTEGTFLLESGIHAMLIDSLFAFKNQSSLNIDFIKNKKNEKMNLGGRVYNITHKAKGKIQLTNHIIYEGEMFVLSDYKSTYDIAIPIQYLYNERSKKNCIIKLNLKNHLLEILSENELKKEKNKYSKVKMNFDNYLHMPSIKTKLTIFEGGKKRTLAGNFNLDLGNAAFIFFFKQNKSVQEFVCKNSDIKLQPAYNKKGMLIAEAFTTAECELCNVLFNNHIIAITEVLPKFTTEGNIGIKFFEKSPVIFDFDKSNFYVKKESY